MPAVLHFRKGHPAHCAGKFSVPRSSVSELLVKINQQNTQCTQLRKVHRVSLIKLLDFPFVPISPWWWSHFPGRGRWQQKLFHLYILLHPQSSLPPHIFILLPQGAAGPPARQVSGSTLPSGYFFPALVFPVIIFRLSANWSKDHRWWRSSVCSFL